LVFDPSKSPSSAIKDYSKGKVDKKKNLNDGVLNPFRVSMDDVAKKKEYQILRCVGLLSADWIDCKRESWIYLRWKRESK
jgi:hypothetical protein